ncbi:threonine synthase [Candidatus Micrarchaeota archaeon CG08_land_8_20_14_0_20_49_17]|nr:MAG: threonine synthase [Candidatus Micrarchaeota archaeon CG1_02_49_24]PIU09684.1 MAG: threonine synthase [Candidatus Micrarchaeota archaeon CG08_land_8_20_14_0_20_49_17]PIU82387.1 MAG: threonine synthase [Candidatus Micrarchaeota archaeon CG06_land_8_20_14_3_00_50_6]PIZ98117.1 MAG: threonine synthase [Candidatus Micrarchaeota archaeon CG_4_10_14_0_2_um_filter_49_7]HII53757.1 threonine synthase [Candidatus Micrarchaeota archaeon]
MYKLKCIGCGKEYDEKETCTVCLSCRNPLDIVYDYDKRLEKLDVRTLKTAEICASKYMSFYPIKDYRKLVTLNEGGTPLYDALRINRKVNADGSGERGKNGTGSTRLFLKYEGANPTGAFKDRGSMMELSKAAELGAKAVCCASTGNMAASVSAYASRAGIPCYVAVPDTAPSGKLVQILSYGANLLKVRGTYNDAARLVEALSNKLGFVLTGDYAFRVEGQKSLAYELAEQLNFKAPDYVIAPMGCGTNIWAIWKGFREFRQFGLIDKLPRMVGVQAASCAPIVKAFNDGREVMPIAKPYTIAGAINIGDPLDGRKALAALRESKGYAFEIEDDAMLEAQQMIARQESVFTEPSGAASVAAYQKLLDRINGSGEEATVVCVLTGAGLKDIGCVAPLFAPPTIEPNLEEAERYITKNLFNLKSPISRSVRETKLPVLKTTGDVAKLVKEKYGIVLEQRELQYALGMVADFARKGKPATVDDLKAIVEESMGAMQKNVLEVIDFEVRNFAHRESESRVKVRFNGKEHVVEGRGDGPVDAAINAIRKIVKDGFTLIDYNVGISSGGTDATVGVTITLSDGNGNRVVGRGASPDIVSASVKAFENAFNVLFYKKG